MTVWTLKGRNELSGSVSGTMYLIEDNDIDYYYLINILNSKDIHILDNPFRSSKKIKQLDTADVPKELLAFHKKRIDLEKSHQKISAEIIFSEIEEEKKKQEYLELMDYWVHDLETTKYVISQIGKVYHNSYLQHVYYNRFIYELDNTWELTICSTQNGVERSLELISDKKSKFGEAVKNLMIKTDMPWEICKCFAKNFTEENALIVLAQIKKDKFEVGNNSTIWVSFHSYIHDLVEKTQVIELYRLSLEKKKCFGRYVYGNNNIY